MKLLLKTSEFKHNPTRSLYNWNYYNHTKLPYSILEKSFDDSNDHEFLLVMDGLAQDVFLGCSQSGFGDADIIEIEFMVQYT